MSSRLLLFVASLAATAFVPHEAGAYCVENAVAGTSLKSSVVASRQRPPRLFDESVAPGGQACCNPRNADCNPDGAPEDGVVQFRATLEAQGRRLICGAVADPRQPPVLYAPARGYLRTEQNPIFNPQRATNAVNPPIVVRILDGDRRLVTSFPCL